MPQLDQLSACPSCAEPLEEGDLFCGVCGTDLTAAARQPEPGDRPTLGISAQNDAQRAAPEPTLVTPTPTLPDFTLPPPAPRPDAQPDSPPDVRPDARDASRPDPRADLRADLRTDPRADDPEAAEASPSPAQSPAQDAAQGPAPAPVPAPAEGGRRCVACGAGAIDRDGYCEHCGHAQPRERDHVERELEGVAAVSDRGLRHHRNEDSFAVSATALPGGAQAVVAVICDGVSSSTRPDEASAAGAEAACEAMLDSLPRGTQPQQAMHDAMVRAAESVGALAAEVRNPAQNAPACTIVSSVIADGILTVGWIGDSRAYWVPEDRGAPAARLTEDDSWAAQMVAAGLMNEAEAYADARAHAITGWLGADAHEIDPHTASFKPDRPGVVVVCTDGLWNYAESADEMASVVPPDARSRPLDSARRLVGYALESGGHDNVTVAVVPFPTPSGRAGSA